MRTRGQGAENCGRTDSAGMWRRRVWVLAGAVLLLPVWGQASAGSGRQTPAAQPQERAVSTQAGGQAAAARQGAAPNDPPKQVDVEAAKAEPRAEIAGDCASLLKMAEDLKTEMGKTDPDTLSVSVVRKAQAIRQLAHKVQQEIKPVVGKD